MDIQRYITEFKSLAPAVDHWSLRIVANHSESLSVRQGIVQPPELSQTCGAHLTLIQGDGFAYAATSNLTRDGFKHIIDNALRWLESSKTFGLFSAKDIPLPARSGSYHSPVLRPWESVTLSEKLDQLQEINKCLKINDSIVDWQAQLNRRVVDTYLVTSEDINISQTFHYIYPGYEAVANKGAQTQQRSGGGWGAAKQGGLEQLASYDFPQSAQSTAEEALALIDAPQCPTDVLSLLLKPSQMMLQIHESIGHPLELDRILGDERNYAGTSFVTQDMFGHYKYGSELLNITFDPGLVSELASYDFDDEGTSAEKEFLIQDGILLKPLGSATSQVRAKMAGVANARACDWNRPTMDRMANLNLEPGDKSFSDLIAGIENGVLMDANKSWSIDDSRNKFQFGCEYGRLIKDGELAGVVKNPNYRGISATFWRDLQAVGNADTFEIWGTPNCGKGEPNQVIQVGHASPACVFSNVEIFGGE
ncbi:MAG: TldD/PmbA family protein [Gammaproteobacteria bacterium]|nr:TldD/PmbA family protein [Gammaproteobacteria bacterium]